MYVPIIVSVALERRDDNPCAEFGCGLLGLVFAYAAGVVIRDNDNGRLRILSADKFRSIDKAGRCIADSASVAGSLMDGCGGGVSIHAPVRGRLLTGRRTCRRQSNLLITRGARASKL